MPLMNMNMLFTNRSKATQKQKQLIPMLVTQPSPMINTKLNSIHTIINTPKTSCGSCGGGS